MSLSNLFTLVVFGQLVNDFNGFATGDGASSEAEQASFRRTADKQALYLFILFLARFALGYINKFGFRMIGIRLSSGIRLHYLQRLFGQTIHVLDSMPAGAAAGTITSTANTLQIGISEKLGVFLEFSATIVASIVIAFTYSWTLTLVTASSILFILLVLGALLPFIIKGHTQMTKAEGKASAVASEAFSSIRMVTACGAEDRIAARYARWVQVARQKGQFTAPLMALQFGLVVRRYNLTCRRWLIVVSSLHCSLLLPSPFGTAHTLGLTVELTGSAKLSCKCLGVTLWRRLTFHSVSSCPSCLL